MRKTVLTYGLISGAFFALVLFGTSLLLKTENFEASEWLGYSTMVVAFIFVYMAMISYKKHIGNGYISFGRSMGVGLLVVLVSSLCYVAAWLIIYYTVIPDFMDRYSTCVMDKMQHSGKSAAEIKAQMKNIEMMKDIYKTPLGIAGITFLEPLPVGIIVTLISAIILKIQGRKKQALHDLKH